MIETVDLIEPWLYATLSGDATLSALVAGRFSGAVSLDAIPTPYVTFSLMSPRDIIGIGGVRIDTDNLYVVKGVSQGGTWDDVSPIANRIDYLIHRPNSIMTMSNGSLTCLRENVHQAIEVDEGLQYRHLGGVYRIRASADN